MTLKNKTKNMQHIKVGILGAAILLVMMAVPSMSSIVHIPTQVYAQTTNNIGVYNNSHPKDSDEMMANIENDIPGFGGAFMDKNGVLNTYKVSSKASSTQTEAEMSAYLEKHLGKAHMSKGMITLEGKYTFSELLAYKNKLTPLFDQQLNVTAVGIDKTKNLVMIGVETMDKADLVKKELSKLGVPKESVYIVETGKIVSNNHTQKYRPVTGGVQLEYFDSPISTTDCSVGIAADTAAFGRVIVTAGHCSANGVRDHTTYYQSSWPDTLGTGLYGTNPINARYSDSVLILPSVTTSRGVVHRDAGGDVTLVGKDYAHLVGDSVSKSGRSTMDTSGVITNTCMNTLSSLYTQLYCQDYATYSSADGDSGGTVYELLGGNYYWYGIHWGQFTSGPFSGKAILSTVQDIENDQGTLTIH